MRSLSRGLGRAPWTLALIALAVAVTGAALWGGAAGRAVADTLAADAGGIGRGQLWRLLTGPLVHCTPTHLLWDATIFLMLGLAYERRMGTLWPLLVIFGLMAPALGALAADPSLDAYYGLSGVNYTLMAAAVVMECGGRERRWLGLVGGVLLTIKLWRCITGQSAVGPALPEGVHEARLAHLIAAAVGALLALGSIVPRQQVD
jgi:rhomboid family GlyGly-CTERM serine protease